MDFYLIFEMFLFEKNFSLDFCFIILREEYLTIATTRPETLFGDTAIAVHPEVFCIVFLVPQILNLSYN